MKKNRFDLEQEIMNCWNVTTDIDTIMEYVGDDVFFRGMSSTHSDEISNLLLGIRSLYEIKFAKLFRTLEDCIPDLESPVWAQDEEDLSPPWDVDDSPQLGLRLNDTTPSDWDSLR